MNTEALNQLYNLPEDLRTSASFCLWKYENDKDGRLTKVPYNPHRPTAHANVSDPGTFAPFNDAVKQAQAPNVAGVGVRVAGDLVGVDIDHCVNEAGELDARARHIVDALDSYTEISPSGHGVRIFLHAEYVAYHKETYYVKRDGLEIYLPGYTNRFLTVTGNVINRAQMLEKSAELQDVLDEYMRRPEKPTTTRQNTPKTPLSITDNELLEKAMNAKNGALFAELWNGDIKGYPSHSEADIALCNMLAFWTGNDAGRIDSLFRSSGLYREKWDTVHNGVETYGQMTINKAIENTTATYEPKQNNVDTWEPTPARDSGTAAEITPTEPTPEPGDVLDEFLREITTRRYEPIPTGIKELDDALDGGLERKTLITLASAPGLGKTAISQYIFENMARQGHTVVYVNLEMDRTQLLSRSIARIIYERGFNTISWGTQVSKAIKGLSITPNMIKRGYMWTDRQRGLIEDAIEDYRENIAPRFHYVTTNKENSGSIDGTTREILAKLEQITDGMERAGLPAPLVCIDYLQFIQFDDYDMKTERKPDTAEAIARTLKAFKLFAMKHSTTMWIITANNRTANRDGRASMDSGRDTSNIEYSGDVMLSLAYTAVEDRWTYPNGQTDKNGNTKFNTFTPDDINDRVDYCKLNGLSTPSIARRLCLKVTKGRSIEARGSAHFYYNGSTASFEPDAKRDTWNPYKNMTNEEYYKRDGKTEADT